MNFDATNLDVEYVQCAVCDKAITGGKWFARIAHDERLVALCCPLCTDTFQRNPRPYIARILMLERIPRTPQ